MLAHIPRELLALVSKWQAAHADRWSAPRKTRHNPDPVRCPPPSQWIHVTVDALGASLAIKAGDHWARLAVPLPPQSPEGGTVALLASQVAEVAKDRKRGGVLALACDVGATLDGCEVERETACGPREWGPGDGVGSTVQLPAGLILELLRAVLPSSSEDETRPALASVRLEREADRAIGVSTDGHRLASHDRPVPTGEPWEATIPRRLAAIVADWIAYAVKGKAIDQADAIRFRLSDGACSIHAAGLTVAWDARSVGQFPPWRQVMPELASTSIRLELDREALARACDAAASDYRVAAKGGSAAPLAVLTFRPVPPPEGYTARQAHTPSGKCDLVLGTVTRELSPIPGRYDGAWAGAGKRGAELLPVGFNATYLSDALRALDAVDPPRKGHPAYVRVALGGELDPCLIGSGGSAGVAIVIMPIRL